MRTPHEQTPRTKMSASAPMVVPVLLAGLGMHSGMARLLPPAESDSHGIIRNEETLEATTYANRLPDRLDGRQCYVLDPMLATGGTLATAVEFLVARGADDVTAVCLLAAPEGTETRDRDTADRGGPRTGVTCA